VTVAAYYEGVVKEMILQLKFHRARSAAGVAAGMVVEALPAYLRADVVCGVPVSPGRQRERGYNQSDLVARRVAAGLHLPFQRLLVRQGSSHQLGTDRRTRFEQVSGAFRAARRLSGESVLLVDDVVTTGATMESCAAALIEAGAGSVWGAAIARH
jgi:ComF family protein